MQPLIQQDIHGDSVTDTAAFTGHRKIGDSWDEDRDIVRWVKQQLLEAVLGAHQQLGIDTFYSGMATGTDMWGAEAVLKARDDWDNDLTLVAAVPFEGQEEQWPAEQQARYKRLLKAADRRVMVNDGGFAYWKYFERNEYMVKRADVMISVYDGREEGGTYSCLRDAAEAKLPVWRIDPKTQETSWQ